MRLFQFFLDLMRFILEGLGFISPSPPTSSLSMATYFVDGAVGSDANAGTSEGAGNAWLTIGKALATVVAGDKVWVKASAIYNQALVISTAGTAAAPIVIEGYSSVIGDEGIATNDGTTGSLVEGMNPLTGSNYYVWRSMRFTNFSGTGFGDLLGDHLYLYKIEADNNGSGGIELDDNCATTACHAHDNTGDGFSVGSFQIISKCISAGNSGDGIQATAGQVVTDCLVYNNGGNGINWVGANAYGLFVNNTIVAGISGTTGTGMALGISSTTNRFVCANNTVSGYSGAGGIGIHTANIGERSLVFNNNTFDNTANYSNTSDRGGGTTTTPDFVNSSAGDYTPKSSSGLLGVGLGVEDCPGAPTLTTQGAHIGALTPAASSGGGGLLMSNKRGNKQ